MDCSVHEGREALTRCGSCDAPLCDECLPHLVDDRRTGPEMEPWCTACVKELRDDSPWPIPAAFAGMSGLAIVLSHGGLRDRGLGWVSWVALLFVAIATWFLYIRGRWERGQRVIQPREAKGAEERTAQPDAVGYRDPARGRKPLRVRAQLPPLSGKRTSVALLTGVFFVGGVTAALGGFDWTSLAVMAGGWWVLWTLAFTGLLYAGRRVADDLPDTVKPVDAEAKKKAKMPWDAAKLPMFLGATGPQAIPIAIALIAILFAVVAVGWVLADLLVAPLFFVGYLGTLTALHHVTREPASYRGDLGRSLGRGALFGLACTLPLALLGIGFLQLVRVLS